MNCTHENFIELSFSALALAFSIGAASFDLKTRQIPNWFNLSAFIIGFVFRLACFFINPNIFYEGLIGFGIGLFIFFPFFIVRFVGGGDVKLLAALGMILGWKNLLWTFSLAHLIDGFFLIPFNLIKNAYQASKQPSSLDGTTENTLLGVKNLKRKIPYALPISLGCFAQLIMLLFFPEFRYLIEILLIKHFSAN